ncbi:MAG: RecQ family ATP-dependent DNA helicase [Egibacteraceae bacterium]
MTSTPSASLDLLQRMAGPDAAFRPGQLEAIDALVADRRRVLLVQRTGWGKSAVYFIATKLLRDAGAGPTLLVSPLLALMRNQIDMANAAGIQAHTINSANTAEWDTVHAAIDEDQVDLLLVSPERLSNLEFRERLQAIAPRTGLLVIDESHCISDWGHDFRPDYRRLARILRLLPRGVPVLCSTATANNRVVADIGEQLGADLLTVRGTLDRESLDLYVVSLPSPAQRMAWLATYLPRLPGSGIVYCLTIRDTQQVAEWLQRNDIDAEAYWGNRPGDERTDIERRLLGNHLKAVVATSALGMGYDKPDLGFVVHYQSPGSPIAYYQQVGRAGRGIDKAFGILLCGAEDRDIQDHFIQSAFPHEPEAKAVLDYLEEVATTQSLNGILAVVNLSHQRLGAALKLLEVEGAVERVGRGWQRSLNPWRYDHQRVQRVTEARRAEQQAMRVYAEGRACLMGFLRRQLDDPGATPCGRCQVCSGQRAPLDVEPALVHRAELHLRGATLTLEPRRRWPAGLDHPSGAIPQESRCAPGRAVCRYRVGQLGAAAQHGKYEGHRFGDDLLLAAVALIRERWRPRPAPTWVTAVPSTSQPELVDGFAERLAARLRLPLHRVLAKTPGCPQQKELQNSVQQARNALAAYGVAAACPPGPVLLVDDLVDSRWTFTVVGVMLREAGSGPVHPLALADAAGR